MKKITIFAQGRCGQLHTIIRKVAVLEGTEMSN